MAEYGVNKGVGRSVEFKGLTAQYLFLFAGGLVGAFIVVIALYMSGVDQRICILLGIVTASLLVWATFRLNSRYGPYGLMKLMAAKQHPRRIIHRRSLRRLIAKRKL